MSKLNEFTIGLGYLIVVLCVISSTTNKITEAQIINNQIYNTEGDRANINAFQSLQNESLRTPTEIERLNITYQNVFWPSKEEQLKLGSVSAVTLDKDLNVVIFHRVDRVWNFASFNRKNVYTEKSKGPIRGSTVLAFDRKTGGLQYQWGENLFYMPHGLTIDKDDNCWVTDVALHQVMKFPPRGGSGQALMVLGIEFVPGATDRHFCKPTSVAVLENGDFFVSDGYCNARIIKFNKHGERILTWGRNTFSGFSYEVAPVNFFAIPHALTLIRELKLICAADRENGRIQCFHWTNGTFHSQYYSELIGDRLFSMDYTSAKGGQFVIVNGPVLGYSSNNNQVWGFVMDFKSQRILSKFGPNSKQFHNPHDIVITPDGSEIYVAELSPTRVYKFTETPSLNRIVESSIPTLSTAPLVDHSAPRTKAIIVVVLMLTFAISTFLLALYMARRRQRGCFLLLNEPKPRHAWDLPAKTEAFKLGNLISKRRVNRKGFTQLDQNASDDEQTADTTTTTFSHTNTTDNIGASVTKAHNFSSVQYT